MLLLIKYESYKGDGALFGFIGTRHDWENFTSKQGGVFTIISEQDVTDKASIDAHATLARSLEDNPFHDDPSLAEQWEEAFHEVHPGIPSDRLQQPVKIY